MMETETRTPSTPRSEICAGQEDVEVISSDDEVISNRAGELGETGQMFQESGTASSRLLALTAAAGTPSMPPAPAAGTGKPCSMSAAPGATTRPGVPLAEMSSSEDEMSDRGVDLTACQRYMRRLLDTQAFRGPLCDTREAVLKSKRKAKLTAPERIRLYYQGKLPAEAVWALPPALRRWPRVSRRKKDLHRESPYMLDAASLPVHAVYHARPRCIDAWA